MSPKEALHWYIREVHDLGMDRDDYLTKLFDRAASGRYRKRMRPSEREYWAKKASDDFLKKCEELWAIAALCGADASKLHY